MKLTGSSFLVSENAREWRRLTGPVDERQSLLPTDKIRGTYRAIRNVFLRKNIQQITYYLRNTLQNYS